MSGGRKISETSASAGASGAVNRYTARRQAAPDAAGGLREANDRTPGALPPLVIIAGPTASGKSAAAVNLAGRVAGSVISADSMQVYRGMDIGSAKITREEMRGIPHYLIDCTEPWEEWNVVRFKKEAGAAAAEIRREGRLPILCGGTGFYIQALLYDIDFTEMEEDAGLRNALLAEAAAQGPGALHARLREIDPEAAESIHPNNVRRVIRALEFARQSGGARISEHNAQERQKPPAYDALFFVLTMDRQKLYARIEERVDRMLKEGLEREVRELKERGLTAGSTSMQGLGYKEILRALDGECSMEEAREQMIRSTRHFAKRQLSWFRRERDVIWVDTDQFDSASALTDALEERVRAHWKRTNREGKNQE